MNTTADKSEALVTSGKLPKPGQGPTAAASAETAFVQFVVAHAAKGGGKGGGGACAHSAVRARRRVGHGIGCGYSGSAYCLIAAALAARAMGRVPAERCGAGLSPCCALDFEEWLGRLRQIRPLARP